MSENNKKDEKEVEIELKQEEPEFKFATPTASHEVNSSELGVFKNSAPVKPREFEKEAEVDLGTAKKDKPKIDFERFTRTKTKNQPTSSFGLKVDHWLRSPIILKNIWIGISALLLFFLVTTITSIALVNQQMSSTLVGPHSFQWIKDLSKVTIAFSYIGMIVPLLPVLFLITSWFVGINGVHSSRIFHYVLWSAMLFSSIFVILELAFTIDILANCWAFNPFPPEPKP